MPSSDGIGPLGTADTLALTRRDVFGVPLELLPQRGTKQGQRKSRWKILMEGDYAVRKS